MHKVAKLCELWHQRFGHLHYGALLGLQNIVTCMLDFHNEHDGVYIGFPLGKDAKRSFPRSSRTSKVILDLVHSDTCGPMTTPSSSG